MTTPPPQRRKICWLSFLSALKKQGKQLDGVLEDFRTTVLGDEDFCWAASQDFDTAARNALRRIAYGKWPSSADIPRSVMVILEVVHTEPDW
jgi:hypothetical protein